MRYFTFKELTATTTGIENVPTWAEIANLQTLATFLDRVRLKFGRAIRVNSGFRSEQVNDAVGGSRTSAHRKGLASDLVAWSGTETDNRALLRTLEGFLTHIDQLIVYFEKPGDVNSRIRFVHVGLCDGVPRMQKLYR